MRSSQRKRPRSWAARSAGSRRMATGYLGQPPGVVAGVQPADQRGAVVVGPYEASEMLRLHADRHAGLRELLDHPQHGIVGFALDLDVLRLE